MGHLDVRTSVPVSSLHPQSMIEYFASDSESKLLITIPQYSELMHTVATNTKTTLMVLDNNFRESMVVKQNLKQDLGELQSRDVLNDNALIIYTSGTTGYPKGVVLTHNNITNQIETLVDAWRWTSNDAILHVLPLHHIHGLVNALLCPLYVGAKCVMLPKFDANDVWVHLLGIKTKPESPKISVFMAVPTVYMKLVEEYKASFEHDPKIHEYIKTNLRSKIRLMVSGSAPLPVPLYEKWLEITGHRLLERYGMSEIGMCLSQLYDSQREPGYVGVPLKGCSVRLTERDDDDNYKTLLECTGVNDNVKVRLNTIPVGDAVVGELHVCGNSVFKEYYNKPDVTRKEFTDDHWFKTGDTCQYSIEKKIFKILGRTNLDVIKTGGYKLSALEIETKILSHPNVVDCAVVGVPDKTWGQIVAALVVFDRDLPIDTLQTFLKHKMASYGIPKIFKVVKVIPKNIMGKVNKTELLSAFLAKEEKVCAKN
ncbi:hypothetical protein PPYR_07944 [Photinus pyralis]|uniref:AMP-dependent synthetase/ligase domain-containing protein n=1 Tax=Photinus pyralis TaxID=7054 RepID=A0A5N4ARW3_PHOPY|nr:malonate--CoA ligase ACSF3, mitochondrial-like [Photinus pyralis]XP_031343877.1 malonate--CoA ligase ACSF3, mitochondrial-like isoform X2 [Photinus pyralis]KAB0800064.1 hypothetical protein PPYR_07944 [Photinus pyralis]